MTESDIEDIFRRESGRVLATLIGQLGIYFLNSHRVARGGTVDRARSTLSEAGLLPQTEAAR